MEEEMIVVVVVVVVVVVIHSSVINGPLRVSSWKGVCWSLVILSLIQIIVLFD